MFSCTYMFLLTYWFEYLHQCSYWHMRKNRYLFLQLQRFVGLFFFPINCKGQSGMGWIWFPFHWIPDKKRFNPTSKSVLWNSRIIPYKIYVVFDKYAFPWFILAFEQRPWLDGHILLQEYTSNNANIYKIAWTYYDMGLTISFIWCFCQFLFGIKQILFFSFFFF